MKFKIGDKVNTPRGVGVITSVDVDDFPYRIKGSTWEISFKEAALTPFKKDLTNLEVGDVVESGGCKRMVLGVCGKIYMMSWNKDFEHFDFCWTAKDLEDYDYKLVSEEETIPVLGKTYKKSDIENALKGIEEIDGR